MEIRSLITSIVLSLGGIIFFVLYFMHGDMEYLVSAFGFVLWSDLERIQRGQRELTRILEDE